MCKVHNVAKIHTCISFETGHKLRSSDTEFSATGDVLQITLLYVARSVGGLVLNRIKDDLKIMCSPWRVFS